MGLSRLEKVGEAAKQISNAARNMSSILNTYLGEYTALLEGVEKAYGKGTTLASLTDAQVNEHFFGGVADGEMLKEARAVLTVWESCITTLAVGVKTLPANI